MSDINKDMIRCYVQYRSTLNQYLSNKGYKTAEDYTITITP